MLDQNKFSDTPMCNALVDLAEELQTKQVPPVELNVIGGFALMMRELRDADGITDIDYVGAKMPEIVIDTIAHVGRKHQMDAGWINNDGMLTGTSMESFELSTGKLHFDRAMTIGPVEINVLDTKDLLRLKIISVDTAMTEIDATGEFARIKDFEDIRNLMIAEGVKPEDLKKEFGDYIICHPETIDLLTQIYEEGSEKAVTTIEQRIEAFHTQGQQVQSERSSYLDNLMDNLLKQGKEIRLEEDDLSFTENPNPIL